MTLCLFFVASLRLAYRSCNVGDTLACAVEGRDEPLPTPGVAPPTLAMVFGVNTGPLQGKEGTHMTGLFLRQDYGMSPGTMKAEESVTALSSHLKLACAYQGYAA